MREGALAFARKVIDTGMPLRKIRDMNGKIDAATGELKVLYSQPQASAGSALATAGDLVFCGDQNRRFRALDAESGKIVWRTPLTAPVRAAPTVAGDRVFITTVDNQLIALAAEDGKKIWDHSGISETAGLLGGASAAVDSGTVIAAYSSGELFALRADTGRVAWA